MLPGGQAINIISVKLAQANGMTTPAIIKEMDENDIANMAPSPSLSIPSDSAAAINLSNKGNFNLQFKKLPEQ